MVDDFLKDMAYFHAQWRWRYRISNNMWYQNRRLAQRILEFCKANKRKDCGTEL